MQAILSQMFLHVEGFSLPQQTDCLALDEVSVLEWRECWRREIARSRDFALIYALFLGRDHHVTPYNLQV